MRRTLSLLCLSLAAASLSAEVRVQVAGSQVDVMATTASLADVLDRLARQTGMKVIYEGAAPRQLVTVTVRGRSQADAVMALLEGQGLNYALMADPTGMRVQTLLIAGSAPLATAASSRAAPAPRRTFGLPPGASPEGDTAFEEPAEDEVAEDPAFAGMPGMEGQDPGAQPAEAAAPDPATQQPAQPPPMPQAPPQQFPVSPFAPQVQPQQPQQQPEQPQVPTPQNPALRGSPSPGQPFPPVPGMPGGPPVQAPPPP